MSYILDAIRKSDWERRRGQVPGVLDRHAAVAPAADVAGGETAEWSGARGWMRPLLFVVVGGAVAGGIAVAALSLTPRLLHNDETVAARDPVAAVAPSAVTPSGGGPAAAPVAAASPPPGPAAAPDAATAALPTPAAPAATSSPMVVVPPGTGWALLPMVPANVAGAAGVPLTMAAPAMEWGGEMPANVDMTDEEIAALLDSHGAPRETRPGNGAAGGAADTAAIGTASRRKSATPDRGGEPAWYADARADLKAMAAAEKTKARGEELAARLPREEPPTTTSVPAASARARPTAAPAIDELPAAVREALPPIALSVHIYAEQPSMRRVRVNAVAVHEGDSVAEGLQVAAITREGVIFRFKGSEFFLAANDSWQPGGTASR